MIDKEKKNLKDSSQNHSKILREIETLLNDLNVDFNEGIIIQLSLDEK